MPLNALLVWYRCGTGTVVKPDEALVRERARSGLTLAAPPEPLAEANPPLPLNELVNARGERIARRFEPFTVAVNRVSPASTLGEP